MLCIATRWETSYEFLLGVHMHHYIPNCDYYQENVWSQFIMLPNMCSVIERKPAKLGQWHKFYNSHIFGENVLDICTCFHVLYLCLRYFSAHALDNLVVTSREKSFLVAKIFLLSDFLFPNLVKDYFFGRTDELAIYSFSVPQCLLHKIWHWRSILANCAQYYNILSSPHSDHLSWCIWPKRITSSCGLHCASYHLYSFIQPILQKAPSSIIQDFPCTG